MKFTSVTCLAFVVLGSSVTANTANASVPACPASLGAYAVTVQPDGVVVCPTTTPPPGHSGSTGCPLDLGLVRVDTATGATTSILGPCVADPQNTDDDGGTPCYFDPCVEPGTYEYGYESSPFAFCNSACAGPTSGEWAAVATVTASPSNCTPSQESGAVAIWTLTDAGIDDGAVRWSGTCTGPLPGPDGGSCAWEWLDGVAQWAPCPPDGGALCPGYPEDGGPAIPILCPTELDAGAANGPQPALDAGGSAPSDADVSVLSDAGASAPFDAGASVLPDAGASVLPDAGASVLPDAGASVPPANASSGGGSQGGGCSTAPGDKNASFGALAALALALGGAVARRKVRRSLPSTTGKDR